MTHPIKCILSGAFHSFNNVSGKIFSATSKMSPFQLLIGSSARVEKITTPKFNADLLRNFQKTTINNSVPAIKSYQRFFITKKHIVNTHAIPHRSFEFVVSQNKIKIGLPSVLLFLQIIGTVRKVHAESSSTIPDQIQAILDTAPENRTPEEDMELFNYLHDRGEKEALKAKGKDVVIIFGDTGAGKSTFINFLWGCTMRENPSDPSLIEVHPASPVSEVALIRSGASSCTLIPTIVGDLLYPTTTDVDQDATHRLKQAITIFDTPGFSDTRGFVVELVNVIVMKKIVDNARSVKFVMFYEYPIKSLRGRGWKETALLFTKRFDVQWQQDKSLSLVITKTLVDISTIKKEIKAYTPHGCEDLSDYVNIYNPLNPDDREKQLSTISKIKIYPRRSIKIVMNNTQLYASRVLGEKLGNGVYDDLIKDKMDQAQKKVKFAQGISELGNADLSKILKDSADGVHKYVDDLILTMDKQNPSPESRYPYLKKYKDIREIFGAYNISFDRHDSDATNIRNKISDTRTIAWDKPTATIVGGVATVGSGIATGAGIVAVVGVPALTGAGAVAAVTTVVVAAPVIAIVGAVATVGTLAFTTYAAVCWLNPSQKDTDTSAYFDKIEE